MSPSTMCGVDASIMDLSSRIIGSLMDRLESMSTLLAAVEAGSLSAASRKLGMPLATVSRKVSELEAHLRPARQPDQPAAHSHRRGAFLRGGVQAHPRRHRRGRARRLRRIRRAARRPGHHRADRVRPSARAPGRDRIPQDLSRHRHPAHACRPRGQPAEDHVDLAVRIGELPDCSLIATRVGAIRRVVCASPDYFAARGTPKTQRPRQARLHHLPRIDGARALAVRRRQIGGVGPDRFAARRQHRRGGDRRRDRIGRRDARARLYQVASALRAGALTLALENSSRRRGRSVSSMPARDCAAEAARLHRLAAPRLKARIVDATVQDESEAVVALRP